MTLALLIIAGTGGTAAWYAIWPYGPCPGCQNRKGRGRGSTPRAWNKCRRCGGSGERLRPVSRLIRRDLARKNRHR